MSTDRNTTIGAHYDSWRDSRLDECRYAYIWADGVYLGAGGDREKTAVTALRTSRILN